MGHMSVSHFLLDYSLVEMYLLLRTCICKYTFMTNDLLPYSVLKRLLVCNVFVLHKTISKFTLKGYIMLVLTKIAF